MIRMRHSLLWLGAAALGCFSLAQISLAQTAKDVVKTYADIALAKYEDSLTTAKALKVAVDKFVASPNQSTLEAARNAWLASRVPYQHT